MSLRSPAPESVEFVSLLTHTILNYFIFELFYLLKMCMSSPLVSPLPSPPISHVASSTKSNHGSLKRLVQHRLRVFCRMSLRLVKRVRRVGNRSLWNTTQTQWDYGANHLVTATFGQAQNHLEVKIHTPLLYMGINRAIRCKDFDAM
ncbi:hypothetical protein PILCRDRAFT_450312 [Piloderma croceum F 1598]|uniref:Uncharacterized protein n=1 Tax=Piloderma croceum (strain F 1598) TaxID=765440 RepID=A0A0C3C0F5_PILCF|nr:hypothetical protein PILCRDRAFT_450312 [Piloderma croceum F 1598]